MSDVIVWVPSGLLAVTSLVLAVALVRLRSRVRDELADVHEDAGRLRSRLDALERRVEAPVERPAAPAYVVTEVGSTAVGSATEGRHAAADRRPDGSLFADLVLRETVVKGASFVHGVRRALAPETRNRIRFEMRQEVKRSRKQRRIDLKAARRHLADQQRADEDAA